MSHHGRALRAALVLVLTTALAAAGCASTPSRPDGARVESITATGDATGARVVIQASQPLEYTAFRLSDPPRIVVDLAGVDLGEAAGSHPPGSPIIESITATEVGEGGSRVGRIEIATDDSTTFTITPDSAARTLTVDLVNEAVRLAEPAGVAGPEPAATPVPTLEATLAPAAEAEPPVPAEPAASPGPAPSEGGAASADAAESPVDLTVPVAGPAGAEPAGPDVASSDAAAGGPGPEASAALESPAPEAAAPRAAASPEPAGPVAVRRVVPRAADGSTEVLIEAGAPITRYEVFRLPSPPRLVVDIRGAEKETRRRRIAVGDPRVARVRLGAHASKVRVVLDLAGSGDYPHEVVPDPRGLLVVVGPKAAAMREPAPEAPARVAAAAASGRPEPAGAAIPPVPLETASAPRGGAPAEAEPVAAAPAPAGPAPREVGLPGDGGLPRPPVIRPVVQTVDLSAPRLDVRQTEKRYTGRRISLDFKDADVDNVLRLIAEISNLNIVTTDDVQGKISLRLINVPWDQALDIILQSQGLGMERTGNVVRIAPAAKLKAEDEAALAARAAKQQLEELVLEVIPVNYAAAADLAKQVQGLLTERGKIAVDTRTNSLIVTDIQSVIDQAQALIGSLDSVTPQVLIEARIVEASLDFTREIGVQWGGSFTASAATGNPTGLNFPGRIGVTGGDPTGTGFAVNLPAAIGPGSGGGINFSLGSLTNFLNLDLRLSAMERAGEGRIISSPRVVTLDNKQAVIEQGLSIPYETTSESGTNTTFVDANLNLTVTPHVTNDGSINLKIEISKNAPDNSVESASGQPSISTKEAKTEVLIRDGQTTVIGGIYTIDRSQTVRGVPWFRKLPLIGWLFRNTSVTDTKTELLVFITPRIVQPLQQSARR